MKVCLLILVSLVGYCAAQGITCTKCNQARGAEPDCNEQIIDGGNTVVCGGNEVCTTDIRCAGRGQVLWIKGCENENGITGLDQLICNPARTRCRVHCNSGDFCNEAAPDFLFPALVCTPDNPVTAGPPFTTPPALTTPPITPPETPPPTTPPAGEPPTCFKCSKVEGRDEECNTVQEQCREGEGCFTKFKCRKQGEPGRPLIWKGCEKINKCSKESGKNDNGNYVGKDCCFTDGCNEFSGAALEADILLAAPFCGAP